MGILTKDVERHPCEVEVSHCFDSLHAHVKFTDGAVVWPGDEVIVKGPEIMAPYGEVVRERTHELAAVVSEGRGIGDGERCGRVEVGEVADLVRDRPPWARGFG